MEFNTLTTTLTTFVGVFQAGYSRLAPTINGLLAVLAGIDIVLVRIPAIVITQIGAS